MDAPCFPSRCLTSWSRSEYPGQHSCSSRRNFQSSRPQQRHSHPPLPRPPSLPTAHAAGPGGRCWAVEAERIKSVSSVYQHALGGCPSFGYCLQRWKVCEGCGTLARNLLHGVQGIVPGHRFFSEPQKGNVLKSRLWPELRQIQGGLCGPEAR